jgi:Tfp pilus assembly protein PilZ
MTDLSKDPIESIATGRLRGLVADFSRIIHDGSEKEKTKLLSLIQSQRLLSFLEDWRQRERRRDSRKAYPAPVTYATEDRVFKGFIRDISNGGVFIETPRALSVGQRITLIFSPTLPEGSSSMDQEGPIKITGKILWRVSRGIGVKFETASDDLEEILRSL